jgi:hypothetical protein
MEFADQSYSFVLNNIETFVVYLRFSNLMPIAQKALKIQKPLPRTENRLIDFSET